jgi:hypothetical protein
MGRALEVLSGSAVNSSAALTNIGMYPNDSLAIRSFNSPDKAWLLDVWAYFSSLSGVAVIHSPRMHDNVFGIRNRILVSNVEPLLSGAGTSMVAQRLYSQDLLIAAIQGSGAAQIDSLHMVVLYDNLPGVAARFIDNVSLNANGVNRYAEEVTLGPTVTNTQAYQTPVAINSTFDNLKANTDYALLGITVDVRCGVVGVRGADIGNLRVGVPGEPTQRHITTNFFQRLTDAYGQPLIPVLNSANKSAIFVDVSGTTGAITVVAELQLVELAAKSGTSSGGQYGV